MAKHNKDKCLRCESNNIANEGPESELTCHDCSYQWDTSYYESQLSRLKPQAPYAPSVKFWDGQGAQTNTIDLNLESISVIKEFLNKIETNLKKVS